MATLQSLLTVMGEITKRYVSSLLTIAILPLGQSKSLSTTTAERLDFKASFVERHQPDVRFGREHREIDLPIISRMRNPIAESLGASDRTS